MIPQAGGRFLREVSKYPKPQEGGKTQKTMTWKKAVVASLVLLMALSVLPIMSMGGPTVGHIWLDCDPHERVGGGGWPAGGWVTAHEFAPNAELTFTLIVENRGKLPLNDLSIAMAIHSLDPPTTSDDLQWIRIANKTFYLGDFGTDDYNPFDESSGGRHNVYVGLDAIWETYYHKPGVVPSGSFLYLPVTVKLGGSPNDTFEIHFDAFDGINGYKTPNGHDVTFISGARLPQDKKPPVPIIIGGEERWVYEGDLVVFDGSTSYDPDGTIESYEWDFDAEVDSDEDGDPENDVDASGPIVNFTWYDDYEVDVALTVTDNDGLFATAYQHVYVLNVDPTIDFEGAFIEFELSLRVAGEKWHNVELLVVSNYDPINETWDDELGLLEVERWPGDPDENPSSGESILVSIDISGENTYTAILTYDPYPDDGDAIMGDQPINGQLWGGNPVWLIATFPDGTVCKKHHTFNVQQSIKRDSDHWNHVEPWIVDLTVGAAAGVPIKFVATATDPGSDDLTFDWNWGDLNTTTNTYLYDPIRGPDPAFPPGSPYEPLGTPWDPWYINYTGQIPPLSVTDITYHTYGAVGIYTVTLTVTDDDGGIDTYTVEIEVHAEFGGC